MGFVFFSFFLLTLTSAPGLLWDTWASWTHRLLVMVGYAEPSIQHKKLIMKSSVRSCCDRSQVVSPAEAINDKSNLHHLHKKAGLTR